MILTGIFLFWNVQAHQSTLSSTLLVEQGENEWILQVRSALTAFEYEVEAHFGKSAYTTPEEFRELVIQILQENLEIRFNDELIELQNGVVKLGHETSVTFEVVGIPEVIEFLELTNRGFDDIAYNQSILMVVKKGFSSNQFILDKSNAHTAKLEVGDTQFELVAPTRNTASLMIGIAMITIIIASLMAYLFIRQRRQRRLELIPSYI